MKHIFTTLLFATLLFTTHSALAEDYKLGAGEKITYDVKKFFDIGNATLETIGLTELDGQSAFLIILSVDVLNYSGVDKIYLDTETYYPVRIVRRLVFFGTPEEIIEEYDQGSNRVTITKTRKGETTTQVIEKESKLDNVYAFIHRFRGESEFDKKGRYHIALPLTDVAMRFTGNDTIDIRGQPFHVNILEGNPSDLRVLFMTDRSKVPVMIQGKMGFGKVSFVLKDYACGR